MVAGFGAGTYLEEDSPVWFHTSELAMSMYFAVYWFNQLVIAQNRLVTAVLNDGSLPPVTTDTLDTLDWQDSIPVGNPVFC